MKSTLIKCGWLVTLDPAIGEIKGGELLISGNTIKAAGRSLNASADETIDATDKIVMPGLVDTHRHMWQGFLRNVLPDGSLEDYRNVVQRTFGAKMVPDDVYAADLISALGGSVLTALLAPTAVVANDGRYVYSP